MSVELRRETETDHEEVENLTREAFWDIFKPGCDEHLLVHKVRKVPAFVPELDFVAVEDGRIVGNIIYSQAKVVGGDGNAHEVVTFGPVSVLPSFQRRGIGSALIEQTMKLAREMGFRAIVIFGHPAYYSRFGFENAERFGITTADGTNFDAFMALELREGGLEGVTGRFYEDPVFRMDKDEVEAFDRRFPHKEKHVTDTQFR